MLLPTHLLPVLSSSQSPSLTLPCLALPCLALPPPAVTLRWLALGLPLRDCRLRSRYTPGRLGFFNSPCLALPCLALPCLASPSAPYPWPHVVRGVKWRWGRLLRWGPSTVVGDTLRCVPPPLAHFSFPFRLSYCPSSSLRQGRMPPLP